jgi:Pentapeptide repeats (8 copies)
LPAHHFLADESSLRRAFLEDAFLREAHLENSDLTSAHLEGTNLYQAHLEGASLRRAFFDTGSMLYEVFLGDEKMGWASVLDTRWRDVNLSTVKWQHVKILGEEYEARQKMHDKYPKNKDIQIEGYQEAVRASRQLAAVLQSQGLNEDAARFAYRAQKLQRVVLRKQRKFGQYFFSLFLDLLAGYGYRPGRSVLWYLVTIFGFALAYFAFGHLPFLPDAFVFSLTSFHGRGFFPGLGSENSLHNPLVVIAAFEAVIGLLIEISFIATFTQRFFGR